MKNLLKKYSTFIKYIFSAGTSFILDQGLFRLFLIFLKKMIGDASIFVATVLARIISSFYNYYCCSPLPSGSAGISNTILILNM